MQGNQVHVHNLLIHHQFHNLEDCTCGIKYKCEIDSGK